MASGPRPHRAGLSVTWLGHSTVLLELDGRVVLTDPLLRPRVAHLARTTGAPPRGMATPPSVIVCSHAHWDHFDPGSLRVFAPAALIVVPRGLGRRAERLGFRSVVELAEGEDARLDGLRVLATHAEHAAGRLAGWRGPRALGYRIDASQSVYFAGDTDLFAGMSAIGRGGLDLALLPVSGWGPRVPAGHLDPERAVEALRLLRPRVAVPIHWGTYRPLYKRAPYDADAAAASRFAGLARAGAPEVDVRVLAPGEPSRIA